MPGYSTGDLLIHLVGGDLSRTEVRDTYRYQPVQLVQRVLDLMQVTVSAETRQALDNLDAILSVPGLDAVYIGPSDLSLALGMPPRGDNPDPVHMATCDKIRDAAHKAGIKAVMHCAGADFAARLIAQGVSENFGRPFVIDNRGGASGLIAKETVARASPDGYTLLTDSSAIWILPMPMALAIRQSSAPPASIQRHSRSRTLPLMKMDD